MIICLECRSLTDDGGPVLCPGCGTTRIKSPALDAHFKGTVLNTITFRYLPADSPEGYSFLYQCRATGIIS